MNKGLLIGAAVVVAALAISPKYIGTEVEKSLQHNAVQISQLPGYQLEVTTLEQSWFNTRATLTLAMDITEMGAGEAETALELPEITIDLDINHGPLLFSGLGAVGVADWTATVDGQELREHLSWPAETPFYRIQGVTGLSGNSSFQDMFSAFEGKQTELLSSMSFSGYVGSGEITGDEIRYYGAADSLTLQSEKLNITSQQLAVNLQAEADFASMLRGEFYDSDTLFSLEKLNITNSQSAQPIILDGLKFRAQSQVNHEEETGNIALDYRLATLTMPEFNASDLQLAMDVSQISLDFLKAYQEFIRNLAATDPQQLEQATQAFMLDNLLMVLTPEPELNITSLKGTLPQGDFNGYLNSKLVNIDSLPKNMADKGFWIKHTLADAQVQMDKEVAEWLAARQMLNQLKTSVPPQQWDQAQMEQLARQQAPVMLENLSKQGMLSQTEEGYQAVFSLKDGEANLNGTAIPLPM
ncbi:YdgA family protein [Lacimicrobium alkaliphilum]|uniref:DUF945 domain-containing protein n=1 Tax=Lacimicrobium alkaliphilum TaxID=1526571 RepID=A0A0U2PIF9_9ALTE|nr:DUF945 family protein [Lacimicrobium alkaliphilum]ALS99309.1 hypothetical protein AT746_14280 [Lacimicrobium alkaliphilum]